MKQLEKIINVLSDLGGIGLFSEIYESYENMDSITLTNGQKAGIRKCMKDHSSDSKNFKGGNNDFFYSVDGKGKGKWGLRNYQPQESNMTLTQDDISAYEGRKKLKLHIVRERNHYIIAQAKIMFKRLHNDQLFCEVCGFNFSNVYGEIGEDFIEAHHTKAISDMVENEMTKISDIAMVCSNCHSMLHRRKPWLSKDELKKLIR